METETEPLLTPADASPEAPASTVSSLEVDPAPTDPAVSSANRAGEPIDPASVTSSSRPKRDRWLAGVLAVSLLSATAASAATVGALAGAGYIGGFAAPGASTSLTAASTTTSSDPVAISTSDAVVAVAEKASPAVVTITVESAGSGGFGPGSQPTTGIGSGFIFDAGGLILTNNHVIKGSGAITVTLQDGTELTGTVVASDALHDVAVVKVNATGLPTIPIGDSSKLQVGQLVVAIGSPLGTFTETVTSGILSATGRTIDVGSATSRQTTHMTGLLQTDAAINEGNSGGPLLDANGNVIGLDVAVATSAQGIGFAVPISDAATLMAEARAATSAT